MYRLLMDPSTLSLSKLIRRRAVMSMSAHLSMILSHAAVLLSILLVDLVSMTILELSLILNQLKLMVLALVITNSNQQLKCTSVMLKVLKTAHLEMQSVSGLSYQRRTQLLISML